ncbi:MAG: cytidylate kinase-like family protein [Chloroflexi bacterium]|nr:cytidylate kinase-like family protein [Chloroflexota bacterium]
MAIVTISRQLGAGGSEVASGVAKALGLRIVDREAIERAAAEAGVPELALQELSYEGQRSLVLRMLDALRAAPAIPSLVEMQRREFGTPLAMSRGIFTPARPLLSAAMEEYVRMVDMVVKNMAKEGNILILGRASQALLKGHAEALHVLVVAPLANRVEKLMRVEGLTQARAQKRIAASDQARAEYLQRYYGVRWLDPHLYDLIINTGRLSIQTAVQLIVLAQVQRVIPEIQPKSPDLTPAR